MTIEKRTTDVQEYSWSLSPSVAVTICRGPRILPAGPRTNNHCVAPWNQRQDRHAKAPKAPFRIVGDSGDSNVTASLPASAETPAARAPPWATVVTCYSAVDRFFPACGLLDLTEGIYQGNPHTS